MTMSLVLWVMRIKRLSGVGTGDGGGVVSGPDGSPNFGPSGLLRERGTQLGTADGHSRDFRLR